MPVPSVNEKQVLKLSAFSAGAFALAGIGWGLAADSLVIVFDGAYSLVSLILSLLSLGVHQLLQKPADSRFNFGRMVAEPLTVAVKGVVIMLVCVISLVSAIAALASGGREVQADLALVFATANVAGCWFTWRYLQEKQTRCDSELIAAESRQWLMDMVISMAVMGGFMLASLLALTPFAAWAVYADPAMVVLASLYFLTVPLRMTVGAIREVMLSTPEPDLRRRVTRRLSAQGIRRDEIRLAKVGCHLIVDVDAPAAALSDLASTRRKLEACLDDLPLQAVIRVNFYAVGGPLRLQAD
ncbi:MAG: cation transporter [Alteromonadaceae bacterium]|nr:cation transporter [Alteromonadaceae bacterium]